MTSRQDSGRRYNRKMRYDDVREGSTPPALLSPRQVYDRYVGSGEQVVLLDIRNPNEWTGDGRIHGATWIPMYELPRRAVEELPDDVPIVVYCAHGVRSAVMARYLRTLGFTDVIDMAGGLLAWQRAGLPIQMR